MRGFYSVAHLPVMCDLLYLLMLVMNVPYGWPQLVDCLVDRLLVGQYFYFFVKQLQIQFKEHETPVLFTPISVI
jgi:hypothetical protein